MNDDCELFSIFPTPVVKFKVPENLMRHVPSLKERTNSNPSRSHRNIVSEDRYILNNQEYEDLKLWVLSRSKEFLNTVLTINCDILLTQSWANKNAYGQSTHMHSHQNSIVSGVFYMDCPGNGPGISFHKPEAGGMFSWSLEPSYFSDKEHDYTYVSKLYNMQVSTGELILFPSWLIHSVPVNNTNFDRWSLAFNTMSSKLGLGIAGNEFIYPKSE
jgi:uncharacterized protein (TIGR02466 family)